VGHVCDLRAAWDSPAMQRLRERKFGGRCGRCELLSNCGGCRAHALAHGDAFGEDTRCFADELGLVRTPAEVRAVEFAERLGRGVWRARLAASRLLGHGVTSRKDHSAKGTT
jgi:sulfatase maturation enzyme AslB (radical SAM superfamily)